MSHKRFIWKKASNNGMLKDTGIIIDTETGVNYLFAQYCNGAGLTPLLDKDGNPIVTPPSELID